MKSVIITGSKGLIGSELVNHLLGKNYFVHELDILMGHDLSDENFVKKYFREIKADFLVNCFALNDHIVPGGEKVTLFDVSLESLANFLTINTISLFSVCRAFAANNRDKDAGIINFASTYSVVSSNPALYNGYEKDIRYVISKAAVPQLTRHLAVHLAPGIRVNCVIPHGIKHEQGHDFEERFKKLSPMNRMMDKSELNGLIEYLCSDNSSYMTGSIIMVDGGWSIW
ncbi:MAG: SDR family oxidoreductase [Bacteroidota bacterium]